jgi:hypothetical protein
MKENTEKEPAEVESTGSHGEDEALAPEELDKISGGSNDPCEGGQLHSH